MQVIRTYKETNLLENHKHCSGSAVVKVKVKVKQSRYRPGVAQRFQEVNPYATNVIYIWSS